MRLFKHKSIIITFVSLIIFVYILNFFYRWHESFVVQKSTANVHKALGEKQAQPASGGLPGMGDPLQPGKAPIGGGATPVPSGIPGGTEVHEGGTTIQFDKYGNIVGTGTIIPNGGGSGGSTTPAKKQIPVTCPNGQPSGGFVCCPNGQPSGGFSCCPDGTPSGGKKCKTVS